MGALAELNTLFDGLFLGATSVLGCSVGFFVCKLCYYH
jgi:hypothetical protein